MTITHQNRKIYSSSKTPSLYRLCLQVGNLA